uniref:C2H2-type domain-containing protein n=1 Tax=Anopheles culicifacies TaxID=139723 RepID=A0A182MJN1_9DIPT
MAASVYATPPPDLSGEEAVLSDASNSSQTNSSHSSTLKASKRTLSSSFLNAATTQSSTVTTTSQLSSDSLPDLSKKRRKQSMPIRFSANGKAIEIPATAGSDTVVDIDERSLDADRGNMHDEAPEADQERTETEPTSPAMENGDDEGAALLEEQQNNFQKIFLSNLSQLQQKHLQLQQQNTEGFLGLANAGAPLPEGFLTSKINSFIALSGARTDRESSSLPRSDDEQEVSEERPQSNANEPERRDKSREQSPVTKNVTSTDIVPKSRDADLESNAPSPLGSTANPVPGNDEKVAEQPSTTTSPPKISLKKELMMDPEWDGEIRSNFPKPDDWLSIAGLSFPFPPEAAAALSASGYLPQLPLLGVPSVSAYGTSGDGNSRPGVPPLRIFNPEAYCDLCNKEFCNKYFLKTHKANKHGIYEAAPGNGSSEVASSALSAMSNPFNPIHQLSQVFQMQQQQQHSGVPISTEQMEKLSNHHASAADTERIQSQGMLHSQAQSITARDQNQSNASKTMQQLPMRSAHSPKVSVAPNQIQPTVFCDICFKKFSSLSAMRKHRSKAHELSNSNHQLQQQQQQQLHQQQQQQQLQQQLQQHLQQQYHQQIQTQQQHAKLAVARQETSDSGLDSSSGTTGAGGSLQLPDGFREDYTIEQEDATFTPQPRKLSPHSMQAAKEANFSADKLRRLGVVNPEAFCEICCKEYCNKYFLRTHKLKRHGILPTPDELKDEGRQPWTPFLQTSPLNLIMGGTAADVMSAQMALQAASPSSLRKLITTEELGGETVAIEGAKGVEIKREQSPPAKMDNGGADSDDQQQSDGGMPGPSNGDDAAREGTSDEDAEAISVDLQKLQSMIMQLNDLNNIQQQRKVSCGVCGKDLANQYLLHAHMIQEHGALGMDNNNGPKGSRATTPNDMPETCKHCDKEFANVYMLKQHLVEIHGGLSGMPSPKREGFVTPERPTTVPSGVGNGGTGSGGAGNIPMPPGAPGYGERKPSYSMTPTSSYCEICNKELCNKYFMKTHMQRMHGIEIENGAQIGGVVCNICNKELCSKYFLRVHKHNTHGIVEEGAPLPQPRQNGSSAMAGVSDMGAGESGDGGSFTGGDLKPGEVSDLSNRYYSHFTEVCPLCSRRFRSAKWLRAHLLSDHGKVGVEKLKDIEQKLSSNVQNGVGLLGNGANSGGGSGNSRSKSNSPSLKVPNGLNDNKYSSKSPFGGLSPAEAAKFLPKGAAIPTLFGTDQPTSPMGGLKGYQCSYCSFATPLLPLLFIHERSHSSLTIVQQQLLQQQQHHQQEEAQAAAAAAAAALGTSPFVPLLKSESAVSLAKDQSANQLMPGTSSETPSSTPASTPVPSLSQEALNLHHQTRSQSPERAGSPRDADPPTANTKPTSPKPASPPSATGSEPNAMLSEVANMTQRPAVYALPQQSGPLMMQSFLIEESLGDGAGGRPRKDSTDKSEGPLGQDHRFVPAVVFLPVKERILTPMTISFNLSPA